MKISGHYMPHYFARIMNLMTKYRYPLLLHMILVAISNTSQYLFIEVRSVLSIS